MTIRERCIKCRPISYKPGTKRLSNQLLHSVAYCSTTRYSIILAGNLREYCKYYDGIENLYFHSLVKDNMNDIKLISDCNYIKPLRSAI